MGLCGRQRLEGGISKEEEEKPRKTILQEWDDAAIMLSDRAHQLCGTRNVLSRELRKLTAHTGFGILAEVLLIFPNTEAMR